MRTKDGTEFPDHYGPPSTAQLWLAALVPALLVALAIFAASRLATKVPPGPQSMYEERR